MLKEKLNTLPLSPGVYLFLNSNKEILYIGKANNLKRRVNSYFSSELYDRPRIKQMMPYVTDVKVVETNNDIESLVLESLLIKKHKPYYNTEKKDDKSYIWIYISTKDKFPTIKMVRQVTNQELKRGELYGPFPSSSATKRLYTYLRKLYPFCTCKKENSKECLYFHLGLCPGPHQGHITEKDYRKNINEIRKFLLGKKKGHIKHMEKEMKEYANRNRFEEAARLRDRIDDLKYLGQDINIRYLDTDQSYIERRKKVLVQNFIDLKIELGLSNLNRIECYDISNLQGKEAYGSMIVAIDGEMKRSEYRIFKIKEIEKPDDPHMLKEVIVRRFLEENKEKYSSNPDIVLIDGGESQLSVIRNSIPKGICIIGISEGKNLEKKGLKQKDEFWIVVNDVVKKINIQNNRLLIELRDEAHRFALLHHRKARARNSTSSELERIEGVGLARRKMLIKSFGNIENISKATREEINSVVKNRKVTEEIFNHFQKK